jgi:hypothetical protein
MPIGEATAQGHSFVRRGLLRYSYIADYLDNPSLGRLCCVSTLAAPVVEKILRLRAADAGLTLPKQLPEQELTLFGRHATWIQYLRFLLETLPRIALPLVVALHADVNDARVYAFLDVLTGLGAQASNRHRNLLPPALVALPKDACMWEILKARMLRRVSAADEGAGAYTRLNAELMDFAQRAGPLGQMPIILHLAVDDALYRNVKRFGALHEVSLWTLLILLAFAIT